MFPLLREIEIIQNISIGEKRKIKFDNCSMDN